MVVALRVAPSGAGPDLERLAAALDRPARPLFIGRKPCLPSAPLRHQNPIEAPDAYTALARVPLESDAPPRAIWPLGEGPETGETVTRILDLPDLRNWRTGLHGGVRKVVEGTLIPGGTAA